MSFNQLLSGVLAAIASATPALQATAQVRVPRQDTVQPPAPRQTGSVPAPTSLKNLQEQIDTAWGLSSTEVRSRFAGARFLVNTEVPPFADALFRVNDREAECAPQTGCVTTTQTIFRGLQSGDRVYNVRLNFDYDRLTSVLINGLGSSSEFIDLKQGLESVYGPGTGKYPSPEGLGVTHLEWRLPTTTIDLSYLESFGGRTALLYYPTPQTPTEP